MRQQYFFPPITTDSNRVGKVLIRSLFFLSFLMCACEDNDAVVNVAPLRVFTSTTLYPMPQPVVLFLSNDTGEPISFDRWDETVFYYRDKLTETGWVEWTQTGIFPESVQTVQTLEPGETYADTIHVRKPGVYRFRVPVLLNGDPQRAQVLTSNVFEIVSTP